MALIACTECGHKISSLARFCPKCYHPKGTAAYNALRIPDFNTVPFPNRAFNDDTASLEELLQCEFKPSLDEMVILEGRAFLIKGLLNVLDCYAYLTSKRYVLCDASRTQIVFQVGSNDIVYVEEARRLISKKIIITAGSGEIIQVKSQPHLRWLHALREPKSFADTSKKMTADLTNGSAGTLHWYYETAGAAIGPVTENSIIQLIRNNHTIFRNTNVWNASLPEWKRAEETILTIYFNESASSETNSIQATKVSRSFPQFFLSQIKLLFRKFF